MNPLDNAQALSNFSDAAPNVAGWFAFIIPIIILLSLWSLLWKAWALWKSARQSQKGWFVVFLLINTLGILEILYIYIFSKKAEQGNRPTPTGISGEVKM